MPTKEDEEMNGLLKENKMLLRKSSIQKIFMGYTFDGEEDIKEHENYTTSSELGKKRDRIIEWFSI